VVSGGSVGIIRGEVCRGSEGRRGGIAASQEQTAAVKGEGFGRRWLQWRGRAARRSQEKAAAAKGDE
jgi:hypothetical protein